MCAPLSEEELIAAHVISDLLLSGVHDEAVYAGRWVSDLVEWRERLLAFEHSEQKFELLSRLLPGLARQAHLQHATPRQLQRALF